MGYEFTPEQDQRVSRAAHRVLAWGVVSVCTGTAGLMLVIAGVLGIKSYWPMPPVMTVLPLLLVQFGVGWFYIRVGLALRAITRTEGRDITHALTGLRALTQALQLETLATLGALLAGLGAAVLMPLGGA